MTNYKVILLLSYICIATISATVISPALPMISQYFSITQGALTWVVSIFLIGYMIGQLIYGPLANRYGRLKALRIGLSINLVGIVICLLSIWAHTYELLLLGRLISALGAASGLTCTFMLLNSCLAPERAKIAMSFAMVSFTLGIGIAVLVGGVLTDHSLWVDCFYFLLVHGLVMLLYTWQFTETKTEMTPISIGSLIHGYSHALSSSRLVFLSFVLGTTAVWSYLYTAIAPHYAYQMLLLSPSNYGYWNLLNMLGMLGSGFVSQWAMKRFDPQQVITGCMIALVPLLISLLAMGMFHYNHVLSFFIITCAMYLVTGVIYAPAAYLASNSIADTANASSMMSFINIGVAMLCVVLGGYVPLAPIYAMFVVMCAFCVVSAALFFLSQLKRQ